MAVSSRLIRRRYPGLESAPEPWRRLLYFVPQRRSSVNPNSSSTDARHLIQIDSPWIHASNDRLPPSRLSSSLFVGRLQRSVRLESAGHRRVTAMNDFFSSPPTVGQPTDDDVLAETFGPLSAAASIRLWIQTSTDTGPRYKTIWRDTTSLLSCSLHASLDAVAARSHGFHFETSCNERPGRANEDCQFRAQHGVGNRRR